MLWILAFIVLAAAAFFITLGFGVYKISVVDAIMVFFDHILGNYVDPRDDLYVWDTRLPRAIGAIAAGAGLGIAGTVMQNDFKNPLAEPYTMGISSGAFLGATLAIVLNISIIPFVPDDSAVVANSYLFSLIPVGFIVLISKFRKLTPGTMILTGIAVMFLFSSISQIIMVTAPSESMADAYSWRVGSLSVIRWSKLPIMLTSTAILSVLIYFFARKLNVMYVGDKSVKTLGENPANVRIITMVLASLLTAGIVCYTGTIGFIGLVGPHVARIFVGSNNRYLIPASAAFGAAFILIADTIAKVSGINGLPVGVISAMVGGPLFIWILIRMRKNVWARPATIRIIMALEHPSNVTALRIVYISVQSVDARTMEAPVREACADLGAECDLFCVNADDVDDDPFVYHDLVARAKAADLVLMRCMTDPTRMRRFATFEDVLKGCPGYVLVFSGDMDIRLAYRDLFKGDDRDFILLGEYMRNRGPENDRSIVVWLSNRLNGILDAPEPITTRPDGIYHPDFGRDVTPEEYASHLVEGRMTIGILYTSNMWIYDNQDHIRSLIRRLESMGANVIPVFFGASSSKVAGRRGTVDVVRKYFMSGGKPSIDALIMATPFSQLNNSRQDVSGVRTPDDQNFYSTLLDVPVIQTMSVSRHFADYEESAQGIGKNDLKNSVFWPEIDGQIIGVPICSMEGGKGKARRFTPLEDRIDHLAEMAMAWARLRRTPPSERRVAVLMYQSRQDSGRIGNAAGLDTIESVSDMLKRYESEGYTLDHVPADGRALIDEILDNITNDFEWSSSERIKEKAADLVTKQRYQEHYSKIPEFNRRQMEEQWGAPPGDVCVEGGRIVIPGIVNGNIFIGFQPLRGWADKNESIYHDPVLPITHQYLEFYRWLKNDFKADVIIHMGTHGTLEWLPGKSVGLSGKCYPDLVLDGVPHIYPYIIDDPGEGIQCKRRSEAVLIGHMCPTMARAGSYGELNRVENALQEYFKARSETRLEKNMSLVEEVLEAAREADLLKDLHLPEDITVEDFENHVEQLHDYLTDIRDNVIRDGLHILGRAPEGERLEESVYTLTRVRNGDVPALRDAIGEACGIDVQSLVDDPSGTTGGKLNSALLDDVDSKASGLISTMAATGFSKGPSLEAAEELIGSLTEPVRATVSYICDTLVPNLLRMTDEMDNLMHGCEGGYVLPGPSGAPTRGNADILPMGRNYYSVDPDSIPLRSSWEIGKRMADQMIERYMEERGCYPREVGFIIWATDTMKTNGDDVAYILWLLGVKPVWSPVGGQVIGLEVIPLEELGRPRIDVTVRITGLFRDSFPNLIDMIDDAVKMVAALDESDEENYLASNLRKDIVEAMASGISVDEARLRNSVRIFGCPPGAYGPGVNHAIENGSWETVQDLADIYTEWGSYAYGRGMTAVSMKDQFVKRFSRVGVTVKNMPDKEIDILDMDDVYGYLGGMNSFVRAYGREDALTFVGDGSDPDRTRIRSTNDQLQFLYRSKVLNPKFVEGLKKHGYRGVSEVSNLTEYTFGWDATSDVVEDWMYEGLAERYLFDDDTRQWMEDENPHAMMDMLNRLLEAVDRGLWDVKPETLEKLKDIYLDLEERIEEYNDRGRPRSIPRPWAVILSPPLASHTLVIIDSSSAYVDMRVSSSLTGWEYLTPVMKFAAMLRMILHPRSSPSASIVILASSRHHSACCETVGSSGTSPILSMESVLDMSAGLPTAPLATMTASAPVISIALPASSGV